MMGRMHGTDGFDYVTYLGAAGYTDDELMADYNEHVRGQPTPDAVKLAHCARIDEAKRRREKEQEISANKC